MNSAGSIASPMAVEPRKSENHSTALEHIGHSISVCIPHTDAQLKETLKGYGDAIRKNEAHQTFTAPDISLDEAIKNLSKFNLSSTDRYAAEKALLKAQLPGIELSEVWGAEFIEYILKDRGQVRRLERLYLMQNLEVAEAKAKKSWMDMAEGEIPFMTDIRSDLALLTALSEMRLLDLVDGGAFTNESAEILERHSKGKLLVFRQRLQRGPGKKDQAIAYVGRLMRMIGVESICKRVRRFKGDENPDRVYRYVMPSDPFDVAILACVERRYGKLSERSKTEAEVVIQQEIEVDPPSASVLKKEGDGGSSELGMAIGQEVEYLGGRYRVMGVRDIDGVQCWVLEYQGGVRYLPIWVPCEGLSEWGRRFSVG